LKAKTLSSSSVALTWTDQASNETGYLIRAKLGPRGQWFSVSRRGANATSFNVKSLLSGQKYYFTVRAFTINSSSPNSIYASATTAMSVTSFSGAAPIASRDTKIESVASLITELA